MSETMFDYYIRVTMFRGGRVSISKSPLPIITGKVTDVSTAIRALELERERFNAGIDRVLNTLKLMQEAEQKYK